MVVLSYNRIRSFVTESVRSFMSPSLPPTTSPLGQTPRTSRSLYFWSHLKRHSTNLSTDFSRTLDAATPDSSRSVSFEDAITWPYIDDDK